MSKTKIDPKNTSSSATYIPYELSSSTIYINPNKDLGEGEDE